MADHKKEVTLTDLQQTILSNDLYNDTDNAGLDDWIQKAVDGKINNCWKRMQSEWTTKLMNDDSFTDPIPSNQADFVALVTARPDYKNRKTREKSSLLNYEQNIQQEVTKRWEADMNGNWLTKSIRPLTLAFLMIVLTVFTLVDFGYVNISISESWIDLWQILAITCFGAYFGGRSFEKIKKSLTIFLL